MRKVLREAPTTADRAHFCDTLQPLEQTMVASGLSAVERQRYWALQPSARADALALRSEGAYCAQVSGQQGVTCLLAYLLARLLARSCHHLIDGFA